MKTVYTIQNNDNFISGFEFHKICKWSICPRYQMNFKAKEIQTNDFVFLNLDCFAQFIQILFHSKPSNKFILVTHNSDQKFTTIHLNQIKPYVSHIYAINCEIKDPLVSPIPLGFVDSKYKPHNKFIEIKNKELEKSILCYMNFAINTNPSKRQECWNTFINQDWVCKESNIPPEDFYNQVAKSKYVLSPEGTGIDCHRIYESIYLGSIPILKTSELDYFYKDLPVIIVNNWNQITQKYLKTNYLKLKIKLDEWKNANPTWINPSFWLREKNTCKNCDFQCGDLKCGKCKLVHYCNKSCQVADWSNHKNECKTKNIMDRKKKIAICLYGQPRLYKNGYNTIKEFINMNKKHTFDIFFHTWYDENLVGEYYKCGPWRNIPKNELLIESDVINNLINLYKPKDYEYETPIDFDLDIYSKTKMYLSDSKTNQDNINNTLSCMYSKYKVSKILEKYVNDNNVTYDNVISIRFDFLNKMNFLIEDMKHNVINCMDVNNMNVKPRLYIPYNLIVTNYDLFIKYSSVYSNLLKIMDNDEIQEYIDSIGCGFRVVNESLLTANLKLYFDNLYEIIYYNNKIPNFI
jgi:hypothetical protein